MLLPNEEERSVIGYEGLYTVTSFGRVFSLNYRRSGRKHELKLCRSWGNIGNNREYCKWMVTLCKDEIQKAYVVSHLVAEAFLGERANRWILHKDGNPLNNNVQNLYYGDRFDNVKDAIRDGTHISRTVTGTTCGTNTLTEDQVQISRTMYRELGYSCKTIASFFSVTYGSINKIISKRTWASLPEPSKEEYKKLAADIRKHLGG